MNLPVPIKHHEGLSFSKLILRCFLFSIIFCAISFLIILGISFALYSTTNPTAKATIGGLISLYSSTFITVFIMTKVNKERWLFGGLILGGIIFLITLLLSALVDGSANAQSIIYRAIIILISLISAFLARKKEPKKRKLKHR